MGNFRDDNTRFQNDEPTYDRPAPPEALAVIVEIFNQHGIPKNFPGRKLEAAEYWLSLQELETRNERPEWISQGRDGGGAWQCPYIARVRQALLNFMRLGGPQQVFVVDWIQRGVPYRGDDLDIYRDIIKNHGDMLASVKEHGRTSDGKLPMTYTRHVTSMMISMARSFESNLPYDKNERES